MEFEYDHAVCFGFVWWLLIGWAGMGVFLMCEADQGFACNEWLNLDYLRFDLSLEGRLVVDFLVDWCYPHRDGVISMALWRLSPVRMGGEEKNLFHKAFLRRSKRFPYSQVSMTGGWADYDGNGIKNRRLIVKMNISIQSLRNKETNVIMHLQLKQADLVEQWSNATRLVHMFSVVRSLDLRYMYVAASAHFSRSFSTCHIAPRCRSGKCPGTCNSPLLHALLVREGGMQRIVEMIVMFEVEFDHNREKGSVLVFSVTFWE